MESHGLCNVKEAEKKLKRMETEKAKIEHEVTSMRGRLSRMQAAHDQHVQSRSKPAPRKVTCTSSWKMQHNYYTVLDTCNCLIKTNMLVLHLESERLNL